MKKIALSLALALMPVVMPAAALASDGRFYLNANIGGSVPTLPALADELALQGNEEPSGGYSLAVSFGRTFKENQWAGEAHVSVSFHPPFTYENDYEDFEGKLSHYFFGAVAHRRFFTEYWLIPSIGGGIGYGITNLIEGGGKLQAFEAVGIGRLEARLGENTSISLEGAYHGGLSKDSFEDAFLGDVESGIILGSDGTVLKDTYRSFDVRIGITFWLRQKE